MSVMIGVGAYLWFSLWSADVPRYCLCSCLLSVGVKELLEGLRTERESFYMP